MNTNRLNSTAVVCILLFVFNNTALAATVEYNYVGNTFDTNAPVNPLCAIGAPGCFNNITANIELSTALGINQALTTITPDTWSIFDGHTTITELTADYTLFTLQLGTDGAGNIDQWRFIAANTALSLDELESVETTFGAGVGTTDNTRYCTVGTSSSCSFVSVALLNNNPGSWITSTVPVPAAIWLFGSGLLGLLGITRRRQ